MSRPSPADPTWGTAFASVHPGLEGVLAAELEALGVAGKITEGGVTFPATLAHLVRAHVGSRIAGRVLVRLGTVKAATLEELAAGARGLPWSRFVHPRQPIEVDVTSHGSHLKRKEVVAKKVTLAIGDALRGPRLAERRPPAQPVGVSVRIVEDRATVSVDASGELLHRRGWRLETGRAPLRENLAAAVLALAGWRPGEPLVDPMCGSGTFGIEAACMARGLHPGAGRAFAFHRWPGMDARRLGALAPPPGPPVATAITLADRDPAALETTRANASRAGVAADLRLLHSPLETLTPPPEPGLLVANPPWGARVQSADLEAAWRRWGHVLRTTWAGWRVAVVAPGGPAAARLGLGLEVVARLTSGGIPIVVAVGTVRAG